MTFAEVGLKQEKNKQSRIIQYPLCRKGLNYYAVHGIIHGIIAKKKSKHGINIDICIGDIKILSTVSQGLCLGFYNVSMMNSTKNGSSFCTQAQHKLDFKVLKCMLLTIDDFCDYVKCPCSVFATVSL